LFKVFPSQPSLTPPRAPRAWIQRLVFHLAKSAGLPGAKVMAFERSKERWAMGDYKARRATKRGDSFYGYLCQPGQRHFPWTHYSRLPCICVTLFVLMALLHPAAQLQ